MGIKEQLAQGLLPIGSNRRQRAIDAARTVGIVSQPKPTDYERWVERVEPHLWSHLVSPETTAPGVPTFAVHIRCTTHTQAADITATTMSMVDQSWQQWTAQIEVAAASAEVRAAATAAVDHEARLSFGGSSEAPASFSFSLIAGDTLAPRALNEIVAAVRAAEQLRRNVEAIVTDADSCVPSTRRREFPLLVPPPHIDMVDQFDLSSAMLVRTSPTTESSQRSIAQLVADGAVVHVPRVLLHRKRVQPPQRGLLPAVVGDDLRYGTRAYHHLPEGSTVSLEIRNPLSGEAGKRHRERVMSSAGSVSMVLVDAVDSANPARSTGNVGQNDFTAIIDGAVWPTEHHWLDDLVGACARDHVLAVAPLIVAPSGIAFDGGVELVDPSSGLDVDPPRATLKARSGRVDLPPFELARVTPVASLSGRVLVIRTRDLQAIGSLSSRRLFDYAKSVNRSSLIWAHQRWTIEASLADIDPLTPAMAAWRSGRLAHWFDSDVQPHHPAVWRIGEGVW